jgi:hypothetical protein
MLHQLPRVLREIAQPAHANDQLSDRPRIRQLHYLDRRFSTEASSGLGNHRHAGTVLHHPTDRVKAVQAHTQLEGSTSQNRLPTKRLLQRAPAIEADELLVKYLMECDLPTPAQPIVARRNKNQPIQGEWEGLQLGEIGGVDHDASVGEPFRNELHNLMAGPLFQIDVDGGMMSQKGGERPRKEFE